MAVVKDTNNIDIISLPLVPCFNANVSTTLDYCDELDSITITYTHKTTGIRLCFVAREVAQDGDWYHVLSAYRISDPNRVTYAMLENAGKYKLLGHTSLAYHGSKDVLALSNDEVEFTTRISMALMLIKEVLWTIDLDVTKINENSDKDKQVAALLEIDDVVDKYKARLHEEFNN